MRNISNEFTIPDFSDAIPTVVRPYILILFFLVFQMSGGVYMAAGAEISGSLSLIYEDVLMAGFATLIGISITLRIMMRLKLRFPLYVSLISASAGLIICNMVSVNTRSLAVLVLISFFSGILKIWGTFAVNSTIQLWITPQRNMRLWQSYIQAGVQLFIMTSGLAVNWFSFLVEWRSMHLFFNGMLISLILFTLVFIKDPKNRKLLPLYGMDWTGALLWALTLMSLIFVFIYGDHYNWFNSRYILIAVFVGVTALSLNLIRASLIRHPFIENHVWFYKPVWLSGLIALIYTFLLSPSSLLESLFMGAILHYDSINRIGFNWLSIIGVFIGVFLTWYLFYKQAWSYSMIIMLGFLFVFLYLWIMYKQLDYNISDNQLYLPIVLRSMSSLIFIVVFINYNSLVSFKYFWQALSIHTFFAASIGNTLGLAILKELFNRGVYEHETDYISHLDGFSHKVLSDFSHSYAIVHKQAVLLTIHDLYGILSLLAFSVLMIILIYRIISRHRTRISSMIS